MPSTDSKASFLSLPVELRLRIYEYVLITVTESLIVPHCGPHSTASPILTTCKKIHSEATPVLYSKTTFLIRSPTGTSQWLERIGRVNIKFLRNIRILVPPAVCTDDSQYNSSGDGPSWYKLFDELAREASGLRHVYINWDAYLTMYDYYVGMNLRFVRELAKIQGLQSMVVGGYYGVHWPQYLTEKMGVKVLEGETIEGRLQILRKFQQGTENLIP